MSDPQSPKPNGPIETLRDGMLKASIFRNENENGAFFNTTFSKSYKDAEGIYHDTKNFAAGDLLRVSELGRQAHHRVSELRRDEALGRSAQAPTQDERARQDNQEQFRNQRQASTRSRQPRYKR